MECMNSLQLEQSTNISIMQIFQKMLLKYKETLNQEVNEIKII